MRVFHARPFQALDSLLDPPSPGSGLPPFMPSPVIGAESSRPPSRQPHSSNFLPINQALNFLIICLQGDSPLW